MLPLLETCSVLINNSSRSAWKLTILLKYRIVLDFIWKSVRLYVNWVTSKVDDLRLSTFQYSTEDTFLPVSRFRFHVIACTFGPGDCNRQPLVTLPPGCRWVSVRSAVNSTEEEFWQVRFQKREWMVSFLHTHTHTHTHARKHTHIHVAYACHWVVFNTTWHGAVQPLKPCQLRFNSDM